MGRPDGQPNQAQPPVQPTVQPTAQSTASRVNNMGRPDGQPNQAQPLAQPTASRVNIMGRTDGQLNQAQPPVQPTASQNNKVPSHNGAIGEKANIPTGIPINYQTQNRWSSELFDCMNDSENAVITLLAPCVTFGQIAEIVDEGATPCATAALLYGAIFFFGAGFVYSYMFRARIRNKYGLPDAPAPDWITHLVCMQCALCQEYRELKHHGFDPIIGWAGNVQGQQQQEMMAPPTGQRMMG